MFYDNLSHRGLLISPYSRFKEFDARPANQDFLSTSMKAIGGEEEY